MRGHNACVCGLKPVHAWWIPKIMKGKFSALKMSFGTNLTLLESHPKPLFSHYDTLISFFLKCFINTGCQSLLVINSPFAKFSRVYVMRSKAHV